MGKNLDIDMPKLKRCPHCGGEAHIQGRGHETNDYRVYCKECSCTTQMWLQSEEKAIAAWNRRATLPDNKVVEMVFGRGELGVATVAANEGAPLKEVLIYRLPSQVLPIGSSLGDYGKSVEDLENVLVRMHFENAESAHVLERDVRRVLSTFEEPDNKALTVEEKAKLWGAGLIEHNSDASITFCAECGFPIADYGVDKEIQCAWCKALNMSNHYTEAGPGYCTTSLNRKAKAFDKLFAGKRRPPEKGSRR